MGAHAVSCRNLLVPTVAAQIRLRSKGHIRVILGCRPSGQAEVTTAEWLYGPDRVASSRPFQLSRTSPSRTSPSIAAWTAGIASRQSGAIARATSLGQIVAFGARRARRDSAAALGSVIRLTSVPHAIGSSLPKERSAWRMLAVPRDLTDG
jgi:hypothetical protein